MFLLGALGTAGKVLAQGVIPRKATTLPRGKPSGIPFHASFVDVTVNAGLHDPIVYGPKDHKTYVLETLGCGCAFFDYDNDGWLDILILSGTRLGAPPTAGNRLYRNNRDGTFTDVTERAGLAKNGWACGVCVGDYNNDGFEDLFLTYWGQNVLYRNNGDGTFTDVTQEAHLTSSAVRWGTGCAFLDYNRDGLLDLFVSNYMQFDPSSAPKPGERSTCMYGGVPVHCGPRGFPFGRHSLYKNNGDGTFTDVSEPAGIAAARNSYGLTVVVSDFDDDGWPDVYVACDSTPSLLFLNNRDGTFREEGAIRGVAYSEDGQEQAGMGVAVGDYDLDGRLDLLKTNFAEDLPNLYRNLGKGLFQDEARDAGLSVDNRFVSWGAGIFDFDNDGWPDIFIVTGHVYPELEQHFPTSPAATPRLLFRNLGNGRFEELLDQAGPAIAAPHVSRGCAFGDFDNDGDLDILIINLNEPPSLLRNDLSTENHWLKLKLIGTTSNRSAIGARVVVKTASHTVTQEVQSQASFLSCSDSRLHFGLGKETSASIRVRWPSGLWESTATVDAERLLVIKEGAGVISTRKFAH
jgi:hypothetical protein